MKAIRHIVIVGGGTAGWITAGLIAAKYRHGLKVSLVESPTARPIGVGEGTWPTIRETLRRIGVAEIDLIRHCDAAFKQGSKFIGWGNGRDSYYHPFTAPQGFSTVNLAADWSGYDVFADHVAFQPALCEAGCAPRRADTPEYAGLANYAYHLDAGRFGEFLRGRVTAKLGVDHVRADVTGAINDADGYIRELSCAGGHPPIAGDLFVDCTGFAARLLSGHYGVGFKGCGDELMIDTALAVQVPYAKPDAPIACATLSTAQRAGWIWDIGLPHRRGIGHVFSSRFTSDDEAIEDLKAYAARDGHRVNDGDVRRIGITAGHRDTFWVRNCVAIGLAMGFVEPLEASSIVMVELSARMIADQMPSARDDMADVARRFNTLFAYRWERIIDFLKLHYVLSHRDEPFWRASRAPETVRDSLTGLLDTWAHRPPWHGDFTHREEVFSEASHQYVLYGAGFRTHIPDWRRDSLDRGALDPYRREVAKARQALINHLPSHRALIDAMRATTAAA